MAGEGRLTGALPDHITQHARRRVLAQIKAAPDTGIRQEWPPLAPWTAQANVRSPWHNFRCSLTRSRVESAAKRPSYGDQ